MGPGIYTRPVIIQGNTVYTFDKERIHIRMILVHDTTELCALEMQNFNKTP